MACSRSELIETTIEVQREQHLWLAASKGKKGLKMRKRGNAKEKGKNVIGIAEATRFSCFLYDWQDNLRVQYYFF